MAENHNDSKKPEWVDEFIENQSNPFNTESIQDFATRKGVSKQTVYSYRWRHPEIHAEIRSQMSKIFDVMRPVAYKALAARIGKSDNALKLFFQLAGDLVERTEQTVKMTPEAKRERIQELVERCSKALVSSKDASRLNDSAKNVSEP
jgi:hypothetical protein